MTPIPSKSRLIAARRTIALWLFGGKFGSKITLSAKKMANRTYKSIYSPPNRLFLWMAM